MQHRLRRIALGWLRQREMRRETGRVAWNKWLVAAMSGSV